MTEQRRGATRFGHLTALNEIRQAQEALLIAFASQDVFIEEKREILVHYLQIATVVPA